MEPINDYACIGAGAYLARYIIQQYKQANLDPFTLEDATMLAKFVVESAIDYDETCGGEADILVVRNDGDVSNAYPTAAYPDARFISDLQLQMWRLLHNLAHADRGKLREESVSALEQCFEQIRKLNDSYGYTFDRSRWLASQKD